MLFNRQIQDGRCHDDLYGDSNHARGYPGGQTICPDRRSPAQFRIWPLSTNVRHTGRDVGKNLLAFCRTVHYLLAGFAGLPLSAGHVEKSLKFINLTGYYFCS